MLGGLAAACLAFSACSAIGSRHPVGNRAVPEPAKSVDLQRYLGRWYELARYEQGFQKDCEGVTADYSLRPTGGIGVLNRCRKPNGKLSEAKGRAKVVDMATGARARMYTIVASPDTISLGGIGGIQLSADGQSYVYGYGVA